MSLYIYNQSRKRSSLWGIVYVLSTIKLYCKPNKNHAFSADPQRDRHKHTYTHTYTQIHNRHIAHCALIGL